jgi:3'(2'), 5'-bisphosphate nucleotidase
MGKTDRQLRGFMLNHDRLTSALIPVVAAAGRIQMRYFRAGVPVETKADATPVTIADQESEQVIIEALVRLAPDVPVVAEEAMAGGARPAAAPVFFLVDPLDGTREFIAGRGEFTVNIALIEHGRAVFGIVYAPATGDLYVTPAPGVATYARLMPEEIGASLAGFRGREIRARRGDPQALTALVSRSHLTPETLAHLSQYRIAETKAAGSSLKFCLIAAGEGDVYPRAGRTNEWDTAAGQAVLEAAGGSVVTFQGERLVYGKSAMGYRNPDYVAWGAGLP